MKVFIFAGRSINRNIPGTLPKLHETFDYLLNILSKLYVPTDCCFKEVSAKVIFFGNMESLIEILLCVTR